MRLDRFARPHPGLAATSSHPAVETRSQGFAGVVSACFFFARVFRLSRNLSSCDRYFVVIQSSMVGAGEANEGFGLVGRSKELFPEGKRDGPIGVPVALEQRAAIPANGGCRIEFARGHASHDSFGKCTSANVAQRGKRALEDQAARGGLDCQLHDDRPRRATGPSAACRLRGTRVISLSFVLAARVSWRTPSTVGTPSLRPNPR